MSRNIKVQVFLDAEMYNFVRQYLIEHKLQTESRTIYKIISKFHKMQTYQPEKEVADRWNSLVVKRESEIKRLNEKVKQMEYALKHIYKPQVEVVKNEGKI